MKQSVVHEDGLGVLITKKKPSGRVVRRNISIETVTLAITYLKSFISLAMYEGDKNSLRELPQGVYFPNNPKQVIIRSQHQGLGFGKQWYGFFNVFS